MCSIKFARKCSCCHSGMNEGYVIEDGNSYYCSIQCLNQDISDLEYNELYSEGNSETYWTEWDDYEYELINNVLTEIE